MAYVSQARTSAGSTISIATAPATYDLTGFTALTWTVVNEVTDLGEFGKKYTLVSHQQLGDRKVVKRKGSYNNGTMSLKMAHVMNDAGQAMLVTARDSDASYAFKVVLQNGETNYFTAQVMEYTTNVATVDTITQSSVSLELDADVIIVAGT